MREMASGLACLVLLLGAGEEASAKSNCGGASRRTDTLMQPMAVEGTGIPVGASVEYSDCRGTWHMVKVTVPAPITFRGVSFRGGFAFDDENATPKVSGVLAADVRQNGMTFGRETFVTIDEAGRVMEGVLQEAYRVRGAALPAGTHVLWTSDSKTFFADPPPILTRAEAERQPGELVLEDGLTTVGTVTFRANGGLRSATLARETRISRVSCMGHVVFHPSGQLKSCDVAVGERVNGMPAELANFYEDGSLRSIRANLTQRGAAAEVHRWTCFRRDGSSRRCEESDEVAWASDW